MNVRLIAITSYLGGNDTPENDTQSSMTSAAPTEKLIEYAGRMCYRSQGGGSPKATARFIQRRVEEGHESIIEHSSASFEISGISRSCSHQLVRHRLASFSQESQRYVDMSNPEWIIPPDVAADPEAMEVWEATLAKVQEAYRQLRARGIRKEDARFLLPNAAATRLVMTANFRELLHLFRIRISPHAQWEICQVAIQMLEAVYAHAPNVFGGVREQLSEAYPALFESTAA